MCKITTYIYLKIVLAFAIILKFYFEINKLYNVSDDILFEPFNNAQKSVFI